MTTLFFDSTMDDDGRRARVFAGDLFVYSPRPSTLALTQHAKQMIEDAFDGLDPRTAQFELTQEQFVGICAPLKPAFIHDPRTKQLIQGMLADLGCDMDRMYLDVPRLRMMASDEYLKAGVAYQLHPHRDTWYSAPLAQLNWWLPIYEVTADNAMAFHPRYFDQGVKNGSSEFNYYVWNSTGRKDAAKQIKSDERKQPKAEEPVELDPQIRAIPPEGGVLLFSGAQLHSTIPNTSGVTRWSIDFRTVHRADLEAGRAAANVDSSPKGTSLRDFMRGADLQRLPEDLVGRYDNVEDPEGVLVFDPSIHQEA